jgi:predicted  nucleic acid-binding Zn-ribbon protein
LIYKQTNEGAPVRSTDYVAPKLDEGILDILGKSTGVKVQQLNMQSMKLRNENQELQNDLLRSQLPDLKEKPSISNRVGNATYDNLVEGVNLKRQERSQKDSINPLEVQKAQKQNKILDQQFVALSQNNQFQRLSQPIQLKIAEATQKGLETTNDLKAFELKMRNTLDNLGIGSGLAQDIIKILISKIF